MKYNPKQKQFVVPIDDVEMAGALLLNALKNIREMAGLPLDRYEKETYRLQPVDHAQKSIIDAAARIGIDFGGAAWGNELDLRDG